MRIIKQALFMNQLNSIILFIGLVGTTFCRADYHTNTITTPGGSFAFSVDGGPTTNATINLVAGVRIS